MTILNSANLGSEYIKEAPSDCPLQSALSVGEELLFSGCDIYAAPVAENDPPIFIIRLQQAARKSGCLSARTPSREMSQSPRSSWYEVFT
jgi:hypothetical protein